MIEDNKTKMLPGSDERMTKSAYESAPLVAFASLGVAAFMMVYMRTPRRRRQAEPHGGSRPPCRCWRLFDVDEDGAADYPYVFGTVDERPLYP